MRYLWKLFSFAVFLVLSLRHTTKIGSRAIFVAAAFCRDDQTWSCCIIMCELIHLNVWGKNGSCRMLSCRVVSSMCELALKRHDQPVYPLDSDLSPTSSKEKVDRSGLNSPLNKQWRGSEKL